MYPGGDLPAFFFSPQWQLHIPEYMGRCLLILLGTAHRSGLQYSQHFATFHNISQRYQRWLKYISLTCSTAWLTCSTGSTGHKLWSSSCMVLSWKIQNITIQIQVAGILFRLEEHIQSTLNSLTVPVQNHGPWGIYLEMVVSSPQDGRF